MTPDRASAGPVTRTPLTSEGGDMRQKARRNTAPLRKIVSTRMDWTTRRLIEVYECGHERPQPTDIYGPTNAYRRRCRRCKIALTEAE